MKVIDPMTGMKRRLKGDGGRVLVVMLVRWNGI